jgi:hypothetical protein
MHSHPRKPANLCQVSNKVIILFGEECPMTALTSLHFCEKCIKTEARNYQQKILTNVVEPLNQNSSKIDHGYSDRTLHLPIKLKLGNSGLKIIYQIY